MSSVQQQKRTVDQLRREAAIKRIPVSQAAEDLKVRTHMLCPFHSHNLPFASPSSGSSTITNKRTVCWLVSIRKKPIPSGKKAPACYFDDERSSNRSFTTHEDGDYGRPGNPMHKKAEAVTDQQQQSSSPPWLIPSLFVYLYHPFFLIPEMLLCQRRPHTSAPFLTSLRTHAPDLMRRMNQPLPIPSRR